MCSVVAFSGKNKTRLLPLLKESIIRGMHAYGVAYYTDTESVVGKSIKTTKSHDLDEVIAVAYEDKLSPLIFHARYSTSGDWRDHTNNQPLQRNDCALAFNGTLDMGTKEEMENRHGVKLQTSNDGELALLALDAGKLETFVAQTRGSFAGVILYEGRVWGLRNERRPLWVVRGDDYAYFVSTSDIARRAGLTDPKLIPCNKLICL